MESPQVGMDAAPWRTEFWSVTPQNPNAMKTARAHYMPSLLAYLLMLLLGVLSWKAVHAQNVVLKGAVLSPEEIVGHPTVTLVRADGERVPVHVRPNGHFSYEIQPDRVVLLLVTKPGCVDKVMRIDTRNADRPDRKGNRTVDFEVHLQAANGDADVRYSNAVGNITFHRSNGRMLVAHNYSHCDDLSMACLALE